MIHVSSGARVGDPLLPLARARADSSLAQSGSVELRVEDQFILYGRDVFGAIIERIKILDTALIRCHFSIQIESLWCHELDAMR